MADSTPAAWTKLSSFGAVRTVDVPAAGLHKVSLWVREDGAAVDRILFTTNSAYTPSGAGPTSSTEQAVTLPTEPLLVQAEDFDSQTAGTGSASGHAWSVVTQDGQGAVRALPNSGLNADSAGVTGPRLDYPVDFPSTGPWYVWTRTMGEGTSDDSSHLGLSGTVISTPGNGVGTFGMDWKWASTISSSGGTRPTMSPSSAGTHTVNLFMREDGAYVDRLLLTQDSSFTPFGAGPEVGTGGSAPVTAEPEHDAAGNVTFDGEYAFAYDAWNRLVMVSAATKSGSTVTVGVTLQTARYDGMGRRVVKQVQNSGALDATYHYYYEGQSQVELRDGSDLVLKQYLWANLAGGYIDNLVEVRVNEDPADLSEDDCERAYLALQDANYNVQALVAGNAAAATAHSGGGVGAVVERYEYTPYGERTVYTGDGISDPYGFATTSRSARVVLSSTP